MEAQLRGDEYLQDRVLGLRGYASNPRAGNCDPDTDRTPTISKGSVQLFIRRDAGGIATIAEFTLQNDRAVVYHSLP